MTADVLDRRALNRATLARQFLLSRSELSPERVITALVGLQAQLPQNPFIGLWSRIESFDPASVDEALLERRLVRIVVMRGTIHLLTADDAVLLRPLMQPVLDAELARHRDVAPHLRDVDLRPVLRFAADLLAAEPLDGKRLRAALDERFPQLDSFALFYACRNLLGLVQVPPRGLWGRSAQVVSTTVQSWLGRPLAAAPSIGDVVLRYLAAFGPATPADAAAWSRLTGFREVFERLQPQLRPFRDERGRMLFDLADAPRPDADMPAPARFFPEYENLLLSHADRSRFQAAGMTAVWDLPPAPFRGTASCDGFVAATWTIEEDTGEPVLVLRPGGALPSVAEAELTEEGRRLLGFVNPGATEVRINGSR